MSSESPASPSPPVALITGGAGELAQAIRQELENQGWSVHSPGHADMDVAHKQDVTTVIGRLPRLDLLVHSAGILRDGSLLKMEDSDFDDVLKVHLKGAFLCAQAALKPMLRQRGGHIINIGSFSALSGPAGQANYAAAKAGLIALTQSLAAEYGARNIRANCVLPGFLDTRMSRPLLERQRAAIEGAHALGRLNTAEDAARFVAFLHTLDGVSGQVFQLDSRIRRWA
ncbi:MAG TPA: SDR family oxidoreductase [Prosthecobacter sp.]